MVELAQEPLLISMSKHPLSANSPAEKYPVYYIFILVLGGLYYTTVADERRSIRSPITQQC